MAMESKLESIEYKGGDDLIKEDKIAIRKALSTTEFVYDEFMWVTKDNGLSVVDWLNYEVDTILSATVLAPFVIKLLELQIDGLNDKIVRNLSNESLIEVFSDLRYAKGTGEVSMYNYYLNKNGFTVYGAGVQIERIFHTVRTELKYRIQ